MKDTKFCSFCNKTFKTLQNKQLHVARVHERKKAFTCPMCNESFVKKYGLERRKVRIHDKIKKNFKCDICNKEMSTPFTLSSHKKQKITGLNLDSRKTMSPHLIWFSFLLVRNHTQANTYFAGQALTKHHKRIHNGY